MQVRRMGLGALEVSQRNENLLETKVYLAGDVSFGANHRANNF